jgi:hypothetical protein
VPAGSISATSRSTTKAAASKAPATDPAAVVVVVSFIVILGRIQFPLDAAPRSIAQSEPDMEWELMPGSRWRHDLCQAGTDFGGR